MISCRVAVVCVALAGALAIQLGAAQTLGAAPSDCAKTDIRGRCVVDLPVPVPGTPPGDTDPVSEPVSGGGPAGTPGHELCRWVNVESTSTLRQQFPEAPPDAVFQVVDCGAFDIRAGVNFRWVPPGTPAAPVPPPPGVVAQLLFARVKVEMDAPVLASDPPVGVSSVVNTPVFVEVTNWQPQITDSECVLGVCVTMTATPALTFDPGDGSGPLVCDPPGSRYVPGGASLADQAVGACAHTYLQRTGVAGRPDAWPGSVTVSWDVNWAGGGTTGVFGPLVFSAPFARSVEEVSAVVVDGST